MNIQYFLASKPFTRNHISCSENALKLTYSNVEFQKFPGGPPLQGEGMGGRERLREREGGRNGGTEVRRNSPHVQILDPPLIQASC